MKHKCCLEKLQTRHTHGMLFIRCLECGRIVVGTVGKHERLTKEDLLKAIRR